MHPDKTTEINKNIFMAVIAKKGFSIRKLGYDTNPDAPIICTEKTIRRSLETGRMKTETFVELAEYLDIDPRYLAGTEEMMHKYHKLSRYLANIDHHPFSREAFDMLREARKNTWLGAYLSAFNISIEQLNAMPFEEQYEFEHSLLVATSEIILKHFKVDADGDPHMWDLNFLISSCEDWKFDHDMKEYADTELRAKLSQNPPLGIPKDEILEMSPEEIINLDVAINLGSMDIEDNPFEDLYKEKTAEQKQKNTKRESSTNSL